MYKDEVVGYCPVIAQSGSRAMLVSKMKYWKKQIANKEILQKGL